MAKERRWYDYVESGEEVPSTMDKPLSKKQREQILERDQHEPQDLRYSEQRGFYRQRCEDCDHKGKDGQGHPQVNHIHPRGWQDDNGNYGRSTLPNGEVDGSNLLTVCRGTHVGQNCDGTRVPDSQFVVHPDTRDANDRYRRGDTNAYHEMQEDRNRKKAQRPPERYWNDGHDAEFSERADELEHQNPEQKRRKFLGIF